MSSRLQGVSLEDRAIQYNLRFSRPCGSTTERLAARSIRGCLVRRTSRARSGVIACRLRSSARPIPTPSHQERAGSSQSHRRRSCYAHGRWMGARTCARVPLGARTMLACPAAPAQESTAGQSGVPTTQRPQKLSGPGAPGDLINWRTWCYSTRGGGKSRASSARRVVVTTRCVCVDEWSVRSKYRSDHGFASGAHSCPRIRACRSFSTPLYGSGTCLTVLKHSSS